VNEEENKELVKEFSLEELKNTIFSMEKNTAPDLIIGQLSFIRVAGTLFVMISWTCLLTFAKTRWT
jgi:hypothetical protein